MNKIYIIILTGLQLVSIISLGQNIQTPYPKLPPIDLYKDRMLIIGKWVAKDDPNDINIFTKDSIYELEGKDTIGMAHYVISDSCCQQKRQGFDYLLEYFYPYRNSKNVTLFCYQIEGLNESFMSLLYIDQGPPEVYLRVK